MVCPYLSLDDKYSIDSLHVLYLIKIVFKFFSYLCHFAPVTRHLKDYEKLLDFWIFWPMHFLLNLRYHLKQ